LVRPESTAFSQITANMASILKINKDGNYEHESEWDRWRLFIYKRSMMTAEAPPPPLQMAAQPS
jgi:hypothetical protein